MSQYNINLHETIYSLSDALDLVGVVQVHHGKRAGYTAVHARLAQFEWEKAHGHCEVGAMILNSTPPLAHLSDTLQF